MQGRFGLSRKKYNFIRNKLVVCLFLCTLMLVASFLLSFIVQGAKNTSARKPVMAKTHRETTEQAETENASPMPTVEITERSKGQGQPAQVDEDDPDQTIIYLTFDDGPYKYTDRLLDILKKHNAKATFFVTGQYPAYLDCIAREKKEGHAIGLHTMTHDFDRIYRSSEDFWQDYGEIQAIVKEQTGSETRLMRFPGGSSNTISNFNPGIMTRLTQEAEDKGYVYFDWNVTSGDAGDTSDSSVILENCKRGVESNHISVILCHDVKEYTVDMVDDFLTWADENGYILAPLTMESTDAHHSVNN